jgi:penicillin amidase
VLRGAAARSGGRPSPALHLLLSWDGNLARDSSAAVLYELWVRDLRAAIVAGFSPPAARPLLLSHTPMPLLIADARRANPDLLLRTVGQAARELASLEGPPGSWAWGKLHTVLFRHPLDQLTSAAAVFDLGPRPRPGDGTTVNATGFDAHFHQTSGASYREIFDLSDWDHSLAVNTPGQSGDPGSPHYADLLPIWDAGEYFPLAYSQSAVERATTETLLLEPKR